MVNTRNELILLALAIAVAIAAIVFVPAEAGGFADDVNYVVVVREDGVLSLRGDWFKLEGSVVLVYMVCEDYDMLVAAVDGFEYVYIDWGALR